ncbi:MAG: YbaB/EbfC family nucleoid-associated protein [Elusimicrobia bacterium]|nr:YbaB/EbfC family nucleoid-associated protein [Elusimicrobiota bacterium]
MDIMKLMKQAQKLKKLQKEISNLEITADSQGARLVISGAGQVKKFEITQELYDSGREKLQSSIAGLVESCLKKQQDLQKEKAKEAMSGLNIPGL